VTGLALFVQAAWDYDRSRRQLVPGFERVGCRYKDHRFAVYNGKKGSESSEKGKDASE
jgi:hypothetical protein